MGWLACLAAALALCCARADNSTLLGGPGGPDACAASAAGPWGALLEEWALAAPAHGDRHGRIMALPPAQGYYVTDRVDRPPPPPPPHASPPRRHPPGGPFPYDEWHAPPAPPPPPPDTKVVNRPPYKDKFKPSPSYNSPPASQQIPAHLPPPPYRPGGGAGAADRIGEAPPPPPPPPPRKQVSETDLYLLSAIEKLVWRVDLMEKRLRKMEESMHYLVAGADKKPEPCVDKFTRVGDACYQYSSEVADWKTASLQCRKLRANLIELETAAERRALLAALLADQRLRGTDVWTGGLNPGLLWIWSHSARPVAGDSAAPAAGGVGGAGDNTTLTVVGEGRCLALVYDPALNTYVYRGQDCALRHRFICEKEEDKTQLSNEIERVARALGPVHTRRARILCAAAGDN